MDAYEDVGFEEYMRETDFFICDLDLSGVGIV